jgi:MFS transporter, UMF1 family
MARTVSPRLTGPQRAWCWYDAANTVFKTSVLAVFFSLYLTDVARADATASGQRCVSALRECAVELLGVRVQAGSLFGFLLAGATVVQVLVLPMVGAIADRMRRKRALLAGFAFGGALATCALASLYGTRWGFASVMFAVALLCYFSSVVVYYAMLPEIAGVDQRDLVSARGWAYGYLGGGLCLALNIALVQAREVLGLTESDAIRICFVMCGLWWAVFTVPALRGLPDAAPLVPSERGLSLFTAGFAQLRRTVADARHYPITLAFLAGYLIFVDGINTVATTAGLYGTQELGLPVTVVTGTVLGVQFVAFAGALAHGWLAARIGATRTILISLGVWIMVVVAAFFVRAGDRAQFYLLALAIGLVLGGTPALARSLYSQLIPKDREAEYFALYTLGERGTSSLGPLVFSIVANATGSFRPAIVSLVGFFAVGFVVTALVPVRRGIRTAGNQEPELT